MHYLPYRPSQEKIDKAHFEIETLLRISRIDEELEQLLGMEANRSVASIRESNALLEEIDLIYLRDDRDEVRRIYRRIDELYTTCDDPQQRNKWLKEEERKLHALYNRYEEIELDEEEQQRLDALHRILEERTEEDRIPHEILREVERLEQEKQLLAWNIMHHINLRD